MNPHDPDPLIVLEDGARPLIWVERLERDARTADHDSIEDGPAFARGIRYALASAAMKPRGVLVQSHRHHERFAIALLLALAFGLGLFVGVRFAAATSRPAPEHVVPASVQGPIGAPLERDAGTASDGGASAPTRHDGGAPSPVTVFEDTSPGITGTASWYPARGYVAAAGPALRTGNWRGRLVVVSANGRSVPVTLSDWCACPRRLIDLSDDAFARLAPLSRGLVQVVVTPAGAIPTQPATDVQP